MVEIDSEILISLVEVRPTLWDKTLEIYKDRNATRNAWREVCHELNPDFENLEDKEKNAFGKEVLRRWTNLRDAFSKSRKKIKESKTSGAGQLKRKKYIFDDQLQFLQKLYESRETDDSIEPLENINREELPDNQANSQAPAENNNIVRPVTASKRIHTENQTSSRPRKHRKPDEVEVKILKALEPTKRNPHIAFIESVMPHLEQFNSSEVLQFQLGVLQLIANINEKKSRIPQPSTFLSQPPLLPQQPSQFTSQAPSVPPPYAYQHYPLPTQSPSPNYPPLSACTTRSCFTSLDRSQQEVNSRQQASTSTYPTSTQQPQPATSAQQLTPLFSQHFEQTVSDTTEDSMSPGSSSNPTIDFGGF